MKEPSEVIDMIDKYKYHVVEFLENPFKDTERASCDFVCVPKSWVKWCKRVYNIVKVWYPTQDTGRKIEEKVMKREKKSEYWQSFLCVLIDSTDIYEQSKIYIRNQKCSQNNNTEDHTPQSEKVKERPCKTTTTLKRKAPPDKPFQNKRSIVNEPGKSVDDETLPHQGSNKDLCKQGTPVGKSNDINSTMEKEKQAVNKNASKASHSLGTKSDQMQELEKCCEMIPELQKLLDQLEVSLAEPIMNKPMNTDNSQSALADDNIVSALSDDPVQAPKLNEEKAHEKQPEVNDWDDYDYEPRKKKRAGGPKPFVLPPNYDPNDSRWTLNHREPGPGLVELVEHSGVYVSATSLHDCNIIDSDSIQWGQRLLSVIFNENALRTCSWTGRKAPGRCLVVRPGLDAHARKVLLDYVIAGTQQSTDYTMIQFRKLLRRKMYDTICKMRVEASW